MRHRVFGRKLNRNYKQKRALFKSLVIALVKNGRIKTTEAKAKAIRPLVDKLVSKVKEGALPGRRWVLAKIPDKGIVEKLFNEIGPLFKNKNSGFTRLIKLQERLGDRAKMVVLEWTESQPKEEKVISKKTAKESL